MSIAAKIWRNLKRPMPDLTAYAYAKIVSTMWRQYLPRVGSSFHVVSGTRLQGCSFLTFGNGFIGGRGLWIQAVDQYSNQRFTPEIIIGNHVTCSDHVHISATERVTIGDGVLLGSKVHITDHSHGVYYGLDQSRPDTAPSLRTLSTGRPVVVGNNVWLGDSVVVLPGVSIGQGSIVGANSVVTKNLPPNVMAVGAPARIIKQFDLIARSWVAVAEE